MSFIFSLLQHVIALVIAVGLGAVTFYLSRSIVMALSVIVGVVVAYVGYQSYSTWRLALIEQGKSECRNAVSAATLQAVQGQLADKVAELEKAAAKTRELEAARLQDQQRLQQLSGRIAEQHQQVSGALKDTKCKVPKAVLDILDAPAIPGALPSTKGGK